jgi:hypothetical protein
MLVTNVCINIIEFIFMKVSWKKRKLFTVKFKGREPRALLWRKKVYEEWFNFAKLAQERKYKVPRAFGNLNSFDDFEKWWRDERYGFELFCEPPMKELVTECTTKNTQLKSDEILLKINLKSDLDILQREIMNLLKNKEVIDEYESCARFRPSRSMKHLSIGATESDFGDFKRQNKFEQYRTTFLLFERKASYKDVALELGWLEGDREWYRTQYVHGDGTIGLIGYEYQKYVDNKVKKVKRHVEQVLKIFKNIEKGTFP